MARRVGRGRRHLLLPVLRLNAREHSGAGALRILGVDPERGFAGGETQVLGLTAELRRLGHRAELTCDRSGQLWERAKAIGVVCHALAIRNAIDLRAGFELRRFLAREPFDVVHFHTSRAHSMAPFARGMARAMVVTRRMDYVPNRWFAPWLYNRAVDGVAAISPAVAEALVAAGVERSRITLIPSGVDCARFIPPNANQREAARAALGLAPDQVAVGALGALEERKGHRYLIEAAALLGAGGTKLRVFIAGDGSQRAALNARARRSDLGGSVTMLGGIDDPRALLWALDIFVMPSIKEGLGVALLEAMACGIAPIAAVGAGPARVIEDQRSGLLVAAAEPAALAQALKRLASAPARRAELGASACARVLASFSLEATARQTLELYRRCLSERAGLAA